MGQFWINSATMAAGCNDKDCLICPSPMHTSDGLLLHSNSGWRSWVWTWHKSKSLLYNTFLSFVGLRIYCWNWNTDWGGTPLEVVAPLTLQLYFYLFHYIHTEAKHRASTQVCRLKPVATLFTTSPKLSLSLQIGADSQPNSPTVHVPQNLLDYIYWPRLRPAHHIRLPLDPKIHLRQNSFTCKCI